MKPFNPTHTKICPICGEEFLPKTRGQKFCDKVHTSPCPICGTPVPMRYSRTTGCCSKECRLELRKRTNLERFGVDNPAKLECIKDKQAQTCLQRYGVETPFQTSDFQDKVKFTSQKKYGTDFPMQCEEVKQRQIQSVMDHYGVTTALKLPRVRKIANKWMGSPEFLEKTKKSNIEKYGVPYNCMREECRKSYHTISKINNRFADLLDFHNIPYEQEFSIDTYSYDFYLPNENIVIEINPTVTHNSYISIFSKTPIKEADYHFKKSQLAKDSGFKCINIWDWDDWDKVLDIISHKETVYARKTSIKEISSRQASEFIEKYHIAGKCRGTSIAYGLYYNLELVEVMTFGKPRYNKQYDYELLRLCTKSGMSIIGGASKLFNYFIKHHTGSIISYCDASKFSGDVYSKIGMHYKSTTSPNKIWSKKSDKITNNLLLSKGYDQLFGTNYGKGTSNEELMLSNGWLPVYDCGQMVFEYKTNL